MVVVVVAATSDSVIKNTAIMEDSYLISDGINIVIVPFISIKIVTRRMIGLDLFWFVQRSAVQRKPAVLTCVLAPL